MIKSWRHKGLLSFYETGSKAGIQPDHARRLKIILQLLDVINSPEQINLPGMRFHQLTGKLTGYYAVYVSGNWRVIFKVEEQDVILVDYLDYH